MDVNIWTEGRIQELGEGKSCFPGCSLHCFSMAFIPLTCTCNLPHWLGSIENTVAKCNKPVTHLCPHHYLFFMNLHFLVLSAMLTVYLQITEDVE